MVIIAAFSCYLAFFLMLNLCALDKNAFIHFTKGQSLNQLSKNLYQAGLVPHASYFTYWVILLGKDHDLQTGYYRVTPDMSLNALLHKMVHGEIEHFKLVIIPGETLDDLLLQIDQSGMSAPWNSQQDWQGMLYPNTYDYVDQTTLLRALNVSRQQMQDHLNQAWISRADHLPYQNPFQVLVMASLLEKESSSYQNQQHIAGVFLHRLQKGMYLDSDPTVRFAVHVKPGVPLVQSDFKSASYFNTYRYKGLPPGPICFVSQQSIQAALHPLKTDDLYFYIDAKQTIFSPSPIHLHLNAVRKLS